MEQVGNAQWRRASAKAGGKVHSFDSAAAPLRTDDEAAGTRPQARINEQPALNTPGSTKRPDHSIAVMYGLILFGMSVTLVGMITVVR